MRIRPKNSKRYRTNIGSRTLILTLKRRSFIIFYIFAPISLFLLLFALLGITKTYQSTVVLSRNDTIGSTQYQIIHSCISNPSEDEHNPGIIYLTAKNLKERNILHSNGSEISTKEIEDGLSFRPFKTVTYSFEIYFTSYDMSIIQSVLNELANISVDTLKVTHPDFAHLYFTPATAPIKNSNEVSFLFYGLVITFLAAFTIAFLYEFFSDKVYDEKDLKMIGIDTFGLKISTMKNEKNNC